MQMLAPALQSKAHNNTSKSNRHDYNTSPTKSKVSKPDRPAIKNANKTNKQTPA
jgi:hypothetical protein